MGAKWGTDSEKIVVKAGNVLLSAENLRKVTVQCLRVFALFERRDEEK